MTRYRLDLGYDGAAFSGWAAQPDLRTVQSELEGWIGRVLRLDAAPTVTCAGRTDAGVHARGQVAHLDLDLPDPDQVAAQLQLRLRKALPADLAVYRVQVAEPEFHARFSAVWRRYRYHLSDGVLDPLHRHTTATIRSPLDVPRMQEAAQQLLGLHDFAAFCRAREGATTIRQLQLLEVERLADTRIRVEVRADAFCHSMVRSLVGALVEIGTGHRNSSWLAGLVDATTRCGEIRVASAQGLVLEEVGYPAPDQLSVRARQARARRELP